MKPTITGEARIMEILGDIRREYCAILDAELNFVYLNQGFKELLIEKGVQSFTSLSLLDVFNEFKKELFVLRWKEAFKGLTPEKPIESFSYAQRIKDHEARIDAEVHAYYQEGDLDYYAIGLDEVTDVFLEHRFDQLKSEFLVRALGVSEIKELMWVLVDELLSQLFFDDALILVKEAEYLIPIAAHGNQREGERRVKSVLKIPYNMGITGLVAQSGKPYICNDCDSDPYYLRRHFEAKSEIAVPILVNGEVFGVINCESQKADFFRPIHENLLTRAAEVLQIRIEEINYKQELQDLEQRHLAIINSTSNSFLLFNKNFQLVSCNTAAIKAWNYFLDVQLREGQGHLEAIPPALLDVFLKAGSRSLQGNHMQEILPWKKDEREFTLKLNFEPARNYWNEVFGFTMLVEDVTELYEANAALHEKNEVLEQSNKELDQFVYSISHDLRAPLSSIMGLVNLIENSQQLPEVKLYTKMLQDATESMDSFIRNILEYSRNKRFELEYTRVDLKNLIQEMTDKFRFLPGYRELDFEVDLELEEIHSDPYRIEIILNNLISNAIKYRDLSKGKSWCKLNISESEDTFTITVSDNGIGISKAKIPMLFDMFFKVKSEHPGSGLGLYILKEVVDHLQGKIEVSSKEKKGTTFTIILPKLPPHVESLSAR